MDLAGRAADLAQTLLAEPLPQHWSHTQGVARQAETLASLAWLDVDTLQAAAWLHGIGYSPGLVDTGFHPLDGARYLRSLKEFPPIVVTLVARHTCSGIEASELEIVAALDAEFPVNDVNVERLIGAITYCDMTTSPLGELVSVDTRLDEILERHRPGDAVHTSISKAAPYLRTQCAEIELALAESKSA